MKKTKKPNRFLNFIKWFFLAFIGILTVGFIYEQISEFTDQQTILKNPPGQVIQVGDHKMHIYCTGENKSGNPTVILVSGGGQIYSTWIKVQSEVSKYTKVCSYDRSGLGFSEANEDIKTNIDVANELKRLLTNARIEGPYIIAGHSVGGFFARVFTKINSNDIKGLILVDSSLDIQEQIYERLDAEKPNLWLMFSGNIIGGLIDWGPYVGLERIIIKFNPELFGLAKEDKVGQAIRSLPIKKQFKGKNMDNFDPSDFSYLKESSNFGSLPLRVLYADESAKEMDPYTDGKSEELQQSQASMSTNSKATRVANSGHFIQTDQPQVVIDTILELIGNK